MGRPRGRQSKVRLALRLPQLALGRRRVVGALTPPAQDRDTLPPGSGVSRPLNAMSSTILIVALVVLAFAGGRYVRQFAARYGMVSGAESLLIGILIGPLAFNLLDAGSLAPAHLLGALLLGLVGFNTGTRARKLAPQPDAVIVGIATSLGTGLILALLTLGWMYHVEEAPADPLFAWQLSLFGPYVIELMADARQLQIAAVLASCGVATSSAVIVSTATQLGARGRVTELLAGAAVTAEIVAISGLGITLAIRRHVEGGARLDLAVTEWALAGVALGVFCGLLFAWFMRDEQDPNRIFVASTGSVIFAAGVGEALGLSPTFINLLAGLTVALVSPRAPAICAELDRLRHPIQVLVMVFAGVLLVLPDGAGWLLVALYPLARWLALRASATAAGRVMLESPVRSPRFGDGLLVQGELPVVIAAAYVMRAPEDGALVLAAVLIATLTTELWSGRALSAVLMDAGEVEQEGAMEAWRR